MARRVTKDRFGNNCMIVGLKDNGKGYPKGFIEIKGTLYKLEYSDSKKDPVLCWLKFTEMPRQRRTGF